MQKRICGTTMPVEKMVIGIHLFFNFAQQIWQNYKNILENKKFEHHPQTMGYVCVNFCIFTIFGF